MIEGSTNQAFIQLFRDAFKKCYGTDLLSPLSETECRHFSNEIMGATGLVIGAKSLKNYSFYVLDPTGSKTEKPSTATLDTLARYVLNAPYTDEITRKDREQHHPYWFRYRSTNAGAGKKDLTGEHVEHESITPRIRARKALLTFTGVLAAALILVAWYLFFGRGPSSFIEDFKTISDDSLVNHGWSLRSPNQVWWAKRTVLPGQLTLYTLPGDNWADSAHQPEITNLLLRKIEADCFTTELHLEGFMPIQRWQQAGMLLLEDTLLTSKSLRLSFAFNDFFGGYDKPKEIIVQAISSGGDHPNNPEEIIHAPVYTLEPGKEQIVRNNLQKSALRIEKDGNRFRFLFATGQGENFAFREILAKDISFSTRYIGLFALQGFVNDSNYLPAQFKYFSIVGRQCPK